ncbi:MAG: ATP-dependent DNA helicase, partial [Candidatus Hydrogenedentes bacterium]|nr:ATP-dependent DNA helicase [Candidatus Hydrogenedentota bacterium]
PLDVLAQQIVAAVACEDCEEGALFALARRAWPYRNLTREEFGQVVQMLAEGFSTTRGRRGALIHHDAINHRIRGRRGARLLALTSGGVIPDSADYRVLLEPSETFLGTVNEDFAVESMAGDVFQLGNASWRILRILNGTVRVEDAKGQPPGIPFWLGEAPARTDELSRAVSELRREIEGTLKDHGDTTAWLAKTLPLNAAEQIAGYFTEAYKSLGAIPSQQTLVMERFFDESGGMQLVLHAPFGSRINRAWGLALRKRFCRSFNFELQAAATEDAIVISLGTQHSFPLEDVFHYLHSNTVREVLIQALLDAPMFTIRWRWNTTRALAVPRQRGGKRTPAPLQRMDAENLLAAVFPDQLACLEHIVGDREIPNHPLVQQTVADCLTEAMDIDGLEAVLRRIEQGEIRCIARDLPEPSPLAHEILNAKPYAFLDNAPLEERRTQAVYTRRASEASRQDDLGVLDGKAIERVKTEAWPEAVNADELHDALLLLGIMTPEEARRTVSGIDPANGATVDQLLDQLARDGRALQFSVQETGKTYWSAAERLPMLRAVFPGALGQDTAEWRPDDADGRAAAIRELTRGRLEASGPLTMRALAEMLSLSETELGVAVLALEGEGFALRGRFHPDAVEEEWCDRRLLARIHRLTIDRLRAEIQPVSPQDFYRFLFAWQRADAEHRVEGLQGLEQVLELLDGYELPLAAWEPEVLHLRVAGYEPQWLDRLSFSGRIGWGRLTAPQTAGGRAFSPLRSSPIALYLRENVQDWLRLAPPRLSPELTPPTQKVFDALGNAGALFFDEVVRLSGVLPSQVEQALAELAALGLVTADGFDGLRALLVPSDKRPTFGRTDGLRRRQKHLASIEYAGRWSLLRTPHNEAEAIGPIAPIRPISPIEQANQETLANYARALLRRYGVVFRRLLEREPFAVSWYELGRIYRRWEARGEIRGGHFVGGVSGEQFALPEAIGLLRSIRKAPLTGVLITISAADPLNLQGILTPGPRVAALTGNRLLFRDGLPIAVLESGRTRHLAATPDTPPAEIENTLRIGKLARELRPYYAR